MVFFYFNNFRRKYAIPFPPSIEKYGSKSPPNDLKNTSISGIIDPSKSKAKQPLRMLSSIQNFTPQAERALSFFALLETK